MIRSVTVSALLAALVAVAATADDTELFLGQLSGAAGRPKVLIILDNSGSMNTEVPGIKPAYDPATTYPTQGSVSSSRLYWSTDGKPPTASSDNFVLAASNRCASAQSLGTTGMYTDTLSVWRLRNGTARWRVLNDSDGTRNSQYVECKSDVENGLSSNPGTPALGSGYPLNTSAGPYTTTLASSNVDWNSMGIVTLFSANYMNWYHNTSLAGPTKTRIEVAKEVVTGIIDSNPSVDFGLMVFNRNGSTQPNGGRIVKKITENMTDTERAALKTTVSNINAETYTPLCETMYEAYRYVAGLSVYYGDDEASVTPARDTSAENSGNYISPLGDCQQVYVIYMTDGEPTNDTHADARVDALPGIGTTSGSRLDELAGWLYSTDLDSDPSNGTQRIVTYTIGFATDQVLLESAAEKGGGRYYTADDASELQDAFQGALNEILSTNTTFTAPSVAVNSFNQTRSLNDVYMAMFRPETGARWPGNLKKLRITEGGTMVDANGVLALDPTTGDIKDTAQTFWSATPDGADVTKGGVGGLLAARDPATRVIKTDAGGALGDFSVDNAALTAADFGAADDAEKNALIQWARGVDVDDEDDDEITTDIRPWIMGDPLHSRPVVINYGARSGYSTSNPDVRIVVGTNAGFLHMFNGADGSETWAFMPEEMTPLVKTLRDNDASSTHPYGIDGTAVAYTYDANRDGTLGGGSDKVYLFVGLRRGGAAYYALDISNPDSPTFMWRISNSSAGFSELGQAWSTPVVTKVPGHSGLALVIGAGYDTNKDVHAVGTDDSEGRGVFVVDALTGALIWSVTPAANSATNMQVGGLTDSVPAAVGTLDSNGDGVTDRLYFADTGGNIWRVDMPGNSTPSGAQTTWSIFKLASFGGETADSDRRFFNRVDVVRSIDGDLPYDGVGVGSGNREHPTETSVVNRFYLIRDTDIVTTYHGSGGTEVPLPLVEADMYDATANLIQDGSASQRAAALTTLEGKHGWYITLERSGEKSLSPSVTLNGTLFFSTFSPNSNSSQCVPVPGSGYLYAVSLKHGTAVYEWDSSTTTVTKGDRDVDLGGRLPDTPTPHFSPETIRLIGVGAGENGSGSYDTGGALTTRGTYWYEQVQ